MVNKAELRQFLIQYFSDIELDELSFDYFPDLLNEFTVGMTKSQKTIALIGYCERRGRLDHLLTTLSQLRPQAFFRQFGLVPTLEKSDRDEQRNPNQVFLSHANQDAVFAQQLAGDLRRAGLEVWIAPDSIRPGEKWVDAINRGLETSGIFVLVMTSRAAASKWVRDESSYAIAVENKGVMRFIVLEVDEGEVPPLWSVRQHIPFREDYDEGLQQLLAELRPGRTAKSAAAKGPDPGIERFLVKNAPELAGDSTDEATRQTAATVGQPEPAALKQLATHKLAFPLFLVVDTSGSMAGERIELLTESLRGFLEDLLPLSESLIVPLVSIISFGSVVEEVVPLSPLTIDTLNFSLFASGPTPLGQALAFLASRLADRSQLPASHLKPMILIFTDGSPTDYWQRGLQELNQTELGRTARRVGIGLGDKADLDVLKAISGDSVITVPNPENTGRLSYFFTWLSSSVRALPDSETTRDLPAFPDIESP